MCVFKVILSSVCMVVWVVRGLWVVLIWVFGLCKWVLKIDGACVGVLGNEKGLDPLYYLSTRR